MKKIRIPSFFVALPLAAAALLVLPPDSSQAAVSTWGNASAGTADFNSGTSWLGGVAPTTSGSAIFVGAAVAQPNLTASLSINGLNFSTAATSGYDLTSSNTSVVLTLTSVANSASGAINAANTSGTNIIDTALLLGGAAGATQTFTIASGGTLVVNGPIASTNSINLGIAGSGVLRLNGANTFTGTLTQSGGGTIILGNVGALNGTVLNITSSSDKLAAAVDLTGANKLTGRVILAGNLTINNTPGFGVEFGGNIDLSNGARTFGNSNSAGTTISGTISNDGGNGITFTAANSSLLTLRAINTYTGNTTISGIGSVSVSTIGNSGSNGNLGAGSIINLGATTNAGNLVYTGTGETTNKTVNLAGTTGGGSLDQSGSGLLKFSSVTASGTGNKTLTLQGSTSGTGEISSVLADPTAGALALTKAGTGTWIISNANTYTGATTISAGILQLNHANATQNSTVTINTANGLQFGTGIGTFNLGSLAGSGALNLADVGAAGVALALGGNNATSTYSGVLTGTSAITKVGTGVQTFSGSNSGYSGNITVKSGGISAGAVGSALGTGTVLLGDVTGTANAAVTYVGATGGYATAVTVQSGNSGTASIGTVGNGVVTLNNLITLNKDLYLTSGGTGGSITFNGVGGSGTGQAFSGSGNLNFNGAAGSTMNISGNNSNFSGNVAVNAGTVRINGSTTALSAVNAVSVDSANSANLIVLENVTIAGLNNGANGGGSVSNTGAAKTLTLGGSGTYTFGGAISGTGATQVNMIVAKSGSGTQILTGNNTYGGGTTVTAGTLLINGSNAGSAVTVSNAGSVLGGTGTIAPGASHSLSVGNAATLAPGTDGTVGTLTVLLSSTGDAASFATGVKFAFDLAAPGTNDVLAFTGLTASSSDVTFNNNVINFTNIGGLTGGTYTLFTFDAVSAYTGTLTIGTGLSGFAGSTLTYNTNSIVLNVVPEPATVAMTGLGLMGALYMVRRRRS